MDKAKRNLLGGIATLVLVAMYIAFGGGVFAHGDREDMMQNESMMQQEHGDSGDIENMMNGKGPFQFKEFPHGLANQFDVQQSALSVNPQGKTLLTSAAVTASNWPNLTVSVWGISLNIQVNADAVMLGALASASSTPQVAVGDRVDVMGTIDGTSGSIHATHFKDRTASSAKIQDLQTKIRQLQDQLRQLMQQLRNETDH